MNSDRPPARAEAAGMTSEFDLIEHHFRHLTVTGSDVVEGIGDDCAILRVPDGHELAVTTDTLIADVHFPEQASAADIGWKALACSLSDLAAVGADPAWATLALTLPEADDRWLAGFASGFGELAGKHGVSLVGGDMTRGPLVTVTVQAGGYLPAGTGLLRRGARPGDRLFVSGSPGEAAAGLERLHAGSTGDDSLIRRLHRPEPRVALGSRLRGLASACIDLSDGLAADVGHILHASGVGATVDEAALPRSPALEAAGSPRQVLEWILHGGDDYELCFSVSGEKIKEIKKLKNEFNKFSEIGAVDETPGLRLRERDGTLRMIEGHGYDHFDRRET